MAKAKTDRATAPQSTNDEPAPTSVAVASSAPALEGQELREEAKEPVARKPIVTPDPRGVMSISLGDDKGSPRMRLLRSHQYKQMQLLFEQKPDEKYLAMLAEAGWKDRTESEGVWTKQVASGEWQPVADAERLFKEIGNAIRKDKGLEPVLQQLSVA
jgi:hypothetical protein